MWNWIKKNWLLSINIFLTIILLVAMIWGRFIKINPFLKSPYTPNCNISTDLNNPFLKSMLVSTSNEYNENGYCPPNYNVISSTNDISNSLNDVIKSKRPYLQVCAQPLSKPCENSSVITDVQLVNMEDSNGEWKGYKDRCGENSTLIPIISLNRTNPNFDNAGKLSTQSECTKMGICVSTKTLGEVIKNKGNYIGANDIQFTTETCPNGFQEAGVLFNNCSPTKNVKLCKKYSTIKN